MRIVCDVDGVLANFVTGFNRLLSKVGPVYVDDGFVPRQWSWAGDGIPAEQVQSAWDMVPETENFWLFLPPYPAADDLARLSRSYGDDVYLLSSRVDTPGGSALSQTSAWVETIGCRGDRFSTIISIGARNKAAVAKAVQADVSLDDWTPNVRRLSKIAGHHAFLLDRPWNSKARDLDPVRVASIGEFFERAGKFR